MTGAGAVGSKSIACELRCRWVAQQTIAIQPHADHRVYHGCLVHIRHAEAVAKYPSRPRSRLERKNRLAIQRLTFSKFSWTPGAWSTISRPVGLALDMIGVEPEHPNFVCPVLTRLTLFNDR